jgi:DNA-binding PucR family transcriptional regulator
VAALLVVGAPEAEVDEEAMRLARRIDPTAIGGVIEGAALVFVADPDAPGRRRRLVRVLQGRVAALGPTVGWADAAQSAARGLSAARLALAGGLPADGLIVAEEHLVLLALHADPALAEALAQEALAPLAEVAEPARERLRETLRAWLDQPGQVQAVAGVLGVHPQTVRYRVRQLRDLYGPGLEDPERRLALALALRARRTDPLSV